MNTVYHIADEIAEYLIRTAQTNPLEAMNFLSVLDRAPQWYQELILRRIEARRSIGAADLAGDR